MSTRARIREKGQLTLPSALRRQADLDVGSVVELEVVDDGILVRPVLVDDALDGAAVRQIVAETTSGYAALREDAAGWAAELREREVLTGSLGDGLDE